MITVVFDWVPAMIPGTQSPDPLDLPPDWVIVQETCVAESEAISYNMVDGFAEGVGANNGLGSPATTYDGPIMVDVPPVPPFQIGYRYHSVSTGNRYRKVAGGATVTITLDPSASAACDENGAFAKATVWWQGELISPAIKLTGVSRKATMNGDAWKVITGQQIKAEVVGLGELTVVPGSHNWIVQGADPFLNYIATDTAGQRQNLPGQITSASVLYYTNNGMGTVEEESEEEEPALPADEMENTVECTVTLVFPQGAILSGSLPQFPLTKRSVLSVRPTFKVWNVQDGIVAFNQGKRALVSSQVPVPPPGSRGRMSRSPLAAGLGTSEPGVFSN